MKYFYSLLVCSALAAVLLAALLVWRINTPNTNTPLEETNTQINSPTNNTETNNNTGTSTNTNSTSTSEETPPPSATDEEIGNEDFGSCDEDIQLYCKGVKGKLNLVSCLLDDHKNEISATCLASLERRQQLNEDLVEACKNDQREFCAGVKPAPGEEPLVDCLEEHKPELSPACLEAFEAHDAAKPD